MFILLSRNHVCVVTVVTMVIDSVEESYQQLWLTKMYHSLL